MTIQLRHSKLAGVQDQFSRLNKLSWTASAGDVKPPFGVPVINVERLKLCLNLSWIQSLQANQLDSKKRKRDPEANLGSGTAPSHLSRSRSLIPKPPSNLARIPENHDTQHTTESLEDAILAIRQSSIRARSMALESIRQSSAAYQSVPASVSVENREEILKDDASNPLLSCKDLKPDPKSSQQHVSVIPVSSACTRITKSSSLNSDGIAIPLVKEESSQSSIPSSNSDTKISSDDAWTQDLDVCTLVNFVDIGLRSLASRAPKNAIRGLKVSAKLQAPSLAAIIPSLWSPQYLPSIGFRSGFISSISRSICLIQQNSSPSLASKLSRLSQMPLSPVIPISSEGPNDHPRLRLVLEARLFRMLQKEIYDPSAARKLKPFELSREIEQDIQGDDVLELMKHTDSPGPLKGPSFGTVGIGSREDSPTWAQSCPSPIHLESSPLLDSIHDLNREAQNDFQEIYGRYDSAWASQQESREEPLFIDEDDILAKEDYQTKPFSSPPLLEVNQDSDEFQLIGSSLPYDFNTPRASLLELQDTVLFSDPVSTFSEELLTNGQDPYPAKSFLQGPDPAGGCYS
ncbi:MAG: hypothetical protein M4579_006103 [Chaenotheca gracillima]|nr:MAG: hypothetical protein M4579_006103 [Chaenotheca gracillima]